MSEGALLPKDVRLPDGLLGDWQDILDLASELCGIPAALIMRLVDDDIEVFLSSKGEDNPYRPGAREVFADSGLYCETVIKTQKPLVVPDALADPDWEDNPDVKLDMISYLGFPIMLPNQEPFGTICILDSKAHAYSATIQGLVRRFRDLVQSHLELVYMNTVLGEENQSLSEYLDELQALRGLVPICARCRKIKAQEDYWQSVEDYLAKHNLANFTHGYCPECLQAAVEGNE